MDRSSFPAFVVLAKSDDGADAELQSLNCDQLPAGDLLIEVSASSLNYKDALSANGHPGISPNLPHVPGIDAVGRVVETKDSEFEIGDEVYVSGRDFGSLGWGGWAGFCRVPADWAFPIPSDLEAAEVIRLGTAGFTAAQCVQALLDHGVSTDDGPIVVTGATGGVGCLSIMILSKLGFEVVAVSGKPDRVEWLHGLGASRVIDRAAINDTSGKPMLKRVWAGGVDTVGGDALTTMLRQTQYGGCVAACGLAASPKLEMTVYPFILRAISLVGIDTAWCNRKRRQRFWDLLAGSFRLENLGAIVETVPLADVQSSVDQMLAGKTAGRIVVQVA